VKWAVVHVDVLLLLVGVGEAFGKVATGYSRTFEPSLFVVELAVHILLLGTQFWIHVFKKLPVTLECFRKALDADLVLGFEAFLLERVDMTRQEI
jgi:hypothetical protein